MGFMSWLTKGMGFESDETYSPEDKQRAYEEKLRQKEEKRQRKLEKKNKKAGISNTNKNANNYGTGSQGLQNQGSSIQTYLDNPDQYNTSKYDKPMNDYGVGATNVGGYGSKNVEFVNPVKYDDCTIVINYLRDGESVMLNLKSMEKYDAQRLLDCISGAVYALNGNLRRVDSDIFLITPEGFNIKVPNGQN